MEISLDGTIKDIQPCSQCEITQECTKHHGSWFCGPCLYQFNRKWGESKLKQIAGILEANAIHLIQLDVASPEDDMKRATDLEIVVRGGRVCVRTRRSNVSFRDLTIRAYARGHKTEWHKIREGWGDWYIYAWERPDGSLGDYILVDLDFCRGLGLFDLEDPTDHDDYWPNADGGQTGFVSFPASVLIDHGAVVAYRLEDEPGGIEEWWEVA